MTAAVVIFSFACGAGIVGEDSRERAVRLDIRPSVVSQMIGDTTHLTAVPVNEDGKAIDGYELDWASADTEVATVTESGITTSTGAGTTWVVARASANWTDEHLTDSARVETVQADPVFSGDFESGDFSYSNSGYSWRAPGSSDVQVTTAAAHTGTYGAKITFQGMADGEDASSSIQLNGHDIEEVWVEYWIHIPSNYLHRDQSSSTNNKFFQIWGGSRSDEDVAMIAEVNRVNVLSSGDREESYLDWINASKGSTNLSHRPIQSPYIRTEDHGTWIQMRWHVRVTSWNGGSGGDDGAVEVWKDGTLIYSRTSLPEMICDTESCNNLDTIRFMGWSNSGYDEDTTFFIDDVRVYESNPGW